MTEEERGDGLQPGTVCASALHTFPHTIVQSSGGSRPRYARQDTYISDAPVVPVSGLTASSSDHLYRNTLRSCAPHQHRRRSTIVLCPASVFVQPSPTAARLAKVPQSATRLISPALLLLKESSRKGSVLLSNPIHSTARATIDLRQPSTSTLPTVHVHTGRSVPKVHHLRFPHYSIARASSTDLRLVGDSLFGVHSHSTTAHAD